MLIRGDQLTDRQRAEVLRTFVHRWTQENAQRTYHGRCPACAQQPKIDRADRAVGVSWHTRHAPIVSDAEWLQAHAFHFLKDGSRLKERPRYAEPSYAAI